MILETLATSQIGKISAPADYGMAPLEAIHDRGYLDYLANIYQWNREQSGKDLPIFPDTFSTRTARCASPQLDGMKGYYCYGMDSPILAGTWEAAYWSAQCALSAAEYLVSVGKEGAAAGCVYALCRPPGHHAARDLYGGFCYLNNAAIAAQYLGPQVAILDIDYHHGNGTQEIFYSTSDVLCCSIHADPRIEYPYYWGSSEERGEGAGSGNNFNWPLPKNTGDTEYLDVLARSLEVIASYSPRYLIVSVGFDILDGDPIGGFKITIDGLNRISAAIAGLGIPTLIVQEGGYLLSKLGQCALSFLSPFASRL
jgi:acetoin utilization deacetylase AcuC-like enzyme